MPMNVVDVSGWQPDFDPRNVSGIDAVITKATEGVSYVNGYCDRVIQNAISIGMPWGFYHYAKANDPNDEAQYFIDNCKNYFNHGIPILDWEENQTVDWVNTFVNKIINDTGINPWIYGNPWRFNQGGVNSDCGRWIASYPRVDHPTFDDALGWDVPETQGLICAWQFCSDGIISGYDGNLDCSIYYGDVSSWNKYAHVIDTIDAPINQPTTDDTSDTVVEDDSYKVTIHKK